MHRCEFPLLIIAPNVGVRSETFVRRHMHDLLPAKTAVISAVSGRQHEQVWSFNGPLFDLNDGDNRVIRRGCRAVLRSVGLSNAYQQRQVARFIRKHGVRVAMVEYLDVGVPWLPLLRSLNIPVFGHAHGADVSALLREERWRAAYLEYRHCAGVITVSHHSRDRLKQLGLPQDNIHVIPCGVDVPSLPDRPGSSPVIRCLAVGRMVPKKAPILVLDAFRRALEVCGNLRLDYVGGGELMPAVKQYIQAFGLQNQVTLHGGQPWSFVEQRLKEADVFLQHSITCPDTGDEEGLPVGILEAMSHALPVVSTDHAGISEAVQHGVTGRLVAPGDTQAMARQIVELDRDAELRRTLGEAARRRVIAQFSWEQESRALRSLLGLE
jgi:colanic acid/amylovoran biosynthesis glycosyltransferase